MCVGNSINVSRLDKLDEISADPSSDLYQLIDDDLMLFDKECKYIEPENTKILEGKSSKLKILSINIHSLPGKLTELKHLLDTLQSNNLTIDVVILCETFINENNKSLCFIDNYQLIEEHRSKKSKGGVGIYVHNRLRFKKREDLKLFKEGQFESCFVEIDCRGKNVIAGSIYRIPGTNEREFISDYETVVNKICNENKNLVIGTDQNLDYLKLHQHANTAKFLETNLNANLIPTISKPTRITHTSATLIDNIYVSSALYDHTTSAILVSDISDHFPCLNLIGNSGVEPRTPLVFRSRKINDATIEQVKQRLENVNWDCLNSLDADSGYNYIIENVESKLNEVAPERTIVIPFEKVIREPWMTQGLVKSSFEKDKLFKKCKGLGKDQPKYQRYLEYRNNYNSLKRAAKQTYYAEKINNFRGNSKKLWALLNHMLGKRNDKCLPTDSFVIDEKTITNFKLISDGFCKYFTNVSKELAQKIVKSKKTFEEYLPGPIGESLFLSPTNENEIYSLIASLPNKSSSGYDGVSNILLKSLSQQLLVPLCIVFNKSMAEGIFPEKMKISEIIPLYKTKDKHLMTNYRPVSLLPVISKVLEKLVHKRTYNFLTRNNILYESQYGFRNKHSTINAVTELIGNILNGFEKNQVTVCLFLDLSKAFDTLEHSTLLAKLENYGIRGVALNWFTSYLSNRSHYVKYNGIKSGMNKIPIKYGVPQGSVLGPLLYLIFCNDLHKCIEESNLIMFADDSSISKTHENIKYIFETLSKELTIVIDWFRANKLSLNLNKTNYIVFKPKSMQIDLDGLEISFGNEIIERVDVTKFLGLLVDMNLNWNQHMSKTQTKLSQSLYLLRNFKNTIPLWAMRNVYQAHFHSHINYGLILWGPMSSKSNLKKLTILQNKALRAVANKKYNSAINPICKKYNVMKLADMVDMELSKMSFQVANNLLPEPILNLFKKGRDFHHYNTRNCNNAVVARHRSAIYNKSFLCKSPAIWTTLCQDVKNAKNTTCFTRRLKKVKLKTY